MKEHPIIFNSEMVRAILDGHKTQTRRVIKPQPFRLDMLMALELHCPYGRPYDRLWVKETWAPMCRVADPTCECAQDSIKENHYIEYKADTGNPFPGDWPEENRQDPDCPKWKSSRFMPRKASRITLEIVNVWLEMLQGITQEYSKAEGIQVPNGNYIFNGVYEYRPLFIELWNSINAKRGYGWDVNPWVWAITFKKLDQHQ